MVSSGATARPALLLTGSHVTTWPEMASEMSRTKVERRWHEQHFPTTVEEEEEDCCCCGQFIISRVLELQFTEYWVGRPLVPKVK